VSILILSVLAVPSKALFGRYTLYGDKSSYILFSSRDRGLDSQLEQFSSQNPRFSYIRMGSKFADHVISTLPNALRKSPLILFRSDGSNWATADSAEISQRMRLIQAPVDDQALLPAALAAGFGLCLGLFFR
jgi:hypothetical protein